MALGQRAGIIAPEVVQPDLDESKVAPLHERAIRITPALDRGRIARGCDRQPRLQGVGEARVRRDQLRAEKYEQDRAFATTNLEFVWDSVVTRVLGEGGVTGLEVKNVKSEAVSTLPLDGVFVAIGHIANTEWLAGLLEMKNGFIVTNSLMETNQPGIFACGDIRDTPLRQISTAVGDATLAAFSAHNYVAARRK